MESDSSLRAWGLTVIRVIVGVVFVAHGSQKLFTFGFHGVAGMFSHMGVPLPSVASVVVTFVEFLGGLALVLGLGTRFAAALLTIDMLGAIFFVHAKNGFFTPGIEFPLTLVAANVCLILAGSGALSVEGLLARKS